MDADEVSVGIEQLVNHLRTNQSTSVNLGDIAGVTEVLLATMRRYFNSIDTTLYTEFRDLSEYIQRARSEISELRPNDLQQERIPRAGLELEAIVTATENATGTIMDAAEEIMSADAASDEYVATVNDACMRIFEACSFQDITGQRITKVVATLTYIEERLHGLQDAWGPDIVDAEGDASGDDPRPDSDLLNGPALDGEGIQQDQIDNLLAGTMAARADEDVAEEPARETPEEVAEAVAEVELEADSKIAPEVAAELAVAEPLAGVAHTIDAYDAAVDAEPDVKASQDDIDALFNGGDAMDPAAPKPESAANEVPAAAKAGAVAAAEPELDDIVPLTTNSEEKASQDDIDALFA